MEVRRLRCSRDPACFPPVSWCHTALAILHNERGLVEPRFGPGVLSVVASSVSAHSFCIEEFDHENLVELPGNRVADRLLLWR